MNSIQETNVGKEGIAEFIILVFGVPLTTSLLLLTARGESTKLTSSQFTQAKPEILAAINEDDLADKDSITVSTHLGQVMIKINPNQ